MRKSNQIYFFAKDGKICNFNNKNVLVIGGAYSVDKYFRLLKGYWYESEQQNEGTKNKVKSVLKVLDNKIVGYLVGNSNTEYSYNKNIQAELDNMCVTEECRKLSIGKQLFLDFKKNCQKNNINEIKVVARYNNLNAINFYKK